MICVEGITMDKWDIFYESRPNDAGKYERWTLITGVRGVQYILREYLTARVTASGASYIRNTEIIEMEDFWVSDFPVAAKNRLSGFLEPSHA